MATNAVSYTHHGAAKPSNPLGQAQPALTPAAGKAAALSQATFDSNVIYTPLTIHNSLCVLHSNAGSIFRLLQSRYPHGETVNWMDVKPEPVAESDVQLFQQQHPEYRDSPTRLAKIAGFKHLLDQKGKRCEEGARVAFDVVNRLGDLYWGAQAINKNNEEAKGVMKNLSEAELTSICLFALSISPAASRYSDIKSLIELKLQEKKLTHKTDNLWLLCQELAPRMQRDSFAIKLAQISYLISQSEQTYAILRSCVDLKKEKHLSLDQTLDQYSIPHACKIDAPLLKHLLHHITNIADIDPETDKELVISHRKPSFFLVFALALVEAGRDGKYYTQWCDLIKATLQKNLQLDSTDLNLGFLDNCWKQSSSIR